MGLGPDCVSGLKLAILILVRLTKEKGHRLVRMNTIKSQNQARWQREEALDEVMTVGILAASTVG